MSTLALDPAMPNKVLETARAEGVHNDCVFSENPCLPCSEIIQMAFHKHYGDYPTFTEALLAIMADFTEEESHGTR